MKTKLSVGIICIMLFSNVCCGKASPLIKIDRVLPFKIDYGGDIRISLSGPFDKNFSIFLNDNPIMPNFIYWDGRYGFEWVAEISLGKRTLDGENTVFIQWSDQTSDIISFNVEYISLPIEFNNLFVSYVIPDNYSPNGYKVSRGDLVQICMHGLPTPSKGKDIRVQVISTPSGEKEEMLLSNGSLVLDNDVLKFTMPNFSGSIKVLVDVEGHECDDFIKFTIE